MLKGSVVSLECYTHNNPIMRNRTRRWLSEYTGQSATVRPTPMPLRVLRKTWNNNHDNGKRSTLKMWSQHLRGEQFTKVQLRIYQRKLMEGLHFSGATVENNVTSHGINQWHFHNDGLLGSTKVKTPVLLIHGYASSSMSFFRNVSHLSDQCSDIYAIDLPANGLSTSPPLHMTPFNESIFGHYEDIDNGARCKMKRQPDRGKVQQCIEENENYYIDAIEQWRIDHGIKQFHLVGHSFGGYLSYKYALKYPDSIDKLCLISPLGVENNLLSVKNDKWQVGQIIDKDFTNAQSLHYSRKLNIPKYVFENQLKILRWGGPMGARLCWNYITAAYARVPSLEFKEYMFELFYGKGGISPIARTIFVNLFTRSLLARAPIMESLDSLKVRDVLMCYGQYDWMDKNAGMLAVSALNECDTRARYLEVPSAGHNLFLDNPECFNVALTSFLAD